MDRGTLRLSLAKIKPRKSKRVTFGDTESGAKRARVGSSNAFDDAFGTGFTTASTPKSTAPTLDSYLDSIDEVQYADHFSIDSDNEDNEEKKLTLTATRPTESKLNKIDVEYSTEPFMKQLYHESQTVDGDVYRVANGVTMEGSSLAPILDWYSAGLPLPLMRVIEKCKYTAPTPIQAQALPILMNGNDFLGLAPTGSGKTAAFLIPLCRHVAANKSAYTRIEVTHHGRSRQGGPYAIILVPTRELCIQIRQELEPFAQALQIHALSCYGGSDISSQISQIVKGACNIIVATPGRLIDLLAANNGRVLSLRAVTYMVIDETDRMFDLGFGPQVRKIISAIRPDRQTAVFSATMSASMELLVQRVLVDPVKVTVGVKSTVPSNVTQSAFVLEPENKLDMLLKLLPDHSTDHSATIVFVNTQALADSLSLQLIDRGYKSQALHGGMDQRDRDETINEFRNGHLALLVATSVAARGLDVRQLKVVINYEPATHLEDYVHRAGRTGRAGEKGVCITFLSKTHKRQAYELAQLFDVEAEVKKLADSYHESTPSAGGDDLLGFGGHGLSKLDQKRALHKSIEQEAYLESGPQSNASTITAANSPGLSDIISKVGNSFIARLMINDVSKEARLAVTATHKQIEITENFHVSITLKGEYIAKPKSNISEEKKLHLHIEGADHDSVAGAYITMQDIINKKPANPVIGRYSEF